MKSNNEDVNKSKSDNRSIITLNTLNTLQDGGGKDTIPFRINFIRALLNGNKLESLINLDSCETESFINPPDTSSDEYDKHDTRFILNKKSLNFYKIINQIGGKLIYKKSGTTGHAFQGCIKYNNEEFNYAVKVVAYPKKEKYGLLNDIKRPENAELYMLRVLSYFVLKRQTPHIVLPIGTFDTSIKPFVSLMEENVVNKDNTKYKEFVERYNNKEYYDKVSILICEWANRGDLLDFFRTHYKKFTLIHWKVILFQIISTLAVIQSKYPSFRHNDLKANNILVHRLDVPNQKFSYKVMGTNFIIPNIGYQIKMCDFDFACIPGIVENSKVSADWTSQINVNPEQNRYYDIHFFFNTLIRKGFFPEFLTDSLIPSEIKEFVDRVLPEKYRNSKHVHKRGRLLSKSEFTTPYQILVNDELFKEFIKNKKNNIK